MLFCAVRGRGRDDGPAENNKIKNRKSSQRFYWFPLHITKHQVLTIQTGFLQCFLEVLPKLRRYSDLSGHI